MTRRTDETTDAYHERLAAEVATVTPDQPKAVPDMVLVPRKRIEELIEANNAFVEQMPPSWEGDPLSDAFDALRQALAARPVLPVETTAEGLRKAIHFVEKLQADFVRDCGVYDPSTNATEFSGAAEDVDLTYAEILDRLHALAAAPDTTAAGIYHRAAKDAAE